MYLFTRGLHAPSTLFVCYLSHTQLALTDGGQNCYIWCLTVQRSD